MLLLTGNGIGCKQSLQLKNRLNYVLINRTVEVCEEKMLTGDLSGLTSRVFTMLC